MPGDQHLTFTSLKFPTFNYPFNSIHTVPFDIYIKDIIDVLLTTIILFNIYKVMSQTRSLRVFTGIFVFVTAWILVSKVFEMKLLGGIMDQLVNVGAIAIIVLFQKEIRGFLYNIGVHNALGRLVHYFRNEKTEEKHHRYSHDIVSPITMACMSMSRQKVGALIVVRNDTPLGEYASSGERLDAKISQRLIENIFFKNSPLHDGAMIIKNDRIVSAACILPTSHDLDIPKEFGLRHRAARGISAESDALAIVVSEETGHITLAYKNRFQENVSKEILEEALLRGGFED